MAPAALPVAATLEPGASTVLALMTRARIFVDSRATTIAHIGELAIPIAAGVLMAVSSDEEVSKLAQANLAYLNRQNYSFPPDHGARVVTTIRPDTVFVPFHWVGANRLTHDALDPASMR